jgi:hypothetical protein
MNTLEHILWAVIGGLIVAILTAGITVYNKESPNTKHLARDFILGSLTTGFLYPLIPESFDDMKQFVAASGTGLTGLTESIASASNAMSSIKTMDPGVEVGPANF